MNKPSVGSWMWDTVHSQGPPWPHRLRPAAEPVSPMGQFWSVTHLGQLFLADIASFPPTVHFLTRDKMDMGPAGPEATSDQTYIAWKRIPACRHYSRVTQECSWSGHLCTLLGCCLEALCFRMDEARKLLMRHRDSTSSERGSQQCQAGYVLWIESLRVYWRSSQWS